MTRPDDPPPAAPGGGDEVHKCPACGRAAAVERAEDQTFTFDTGLGRVACHAAAVPVRACRACGEQTFGPRAVRLRLNACLVGVLDRLRAMGVRLDAPPPPPPDPDLAAVRPAYLAAWAANLAAQLRAHNWDGFHVGVADSPGLVVYCAAELLPAARRPRSINGIPVEYRVTGGPPTIGPPE